MLSRRYSLLTFVTISRRKLRTTSGKPAGTDDVVEPIVRPRGVFAEAEELTKRCLAFSLMIVTTAGKLQGFSRMTPYQSYACRCEKLQLPRNGTHRRIRE